MGPVDSFFLESLLALADSGEQPVASAASSVARESAFRPKNPSPNPFPCWERKKAAGVLRALRASSEVSLPKSLNRTQSATARWRPIRILETIFCILITGLRVLIVEHRFMMPGIFINKPKERVEVRQLAAQLQLLG